MELLRVSNNKTRRQALFSGTSKGQPPILSVWEDLLLHLGRAHQTLISRGGSRQSPSAPASRPAPVQDSHTVQVRQANIFRPASLPKTSGLTATIQSALEGPVQAAPPAILGKAQNLALDVKGKAEVKAVEWKEEVVGRVAGTEVGGTVIKEAKGVLAGLGEWVGAEWADRQVRTSIPEPVTLERILDSEPPAIIESIPAYRADTVQFSLRWLVLLSRRTRMATYSRCCPVRWRLLSAIDQRSCRLNRSSCTMRRLWEEGQKQHGGI